MKQKRWDPDRDVEVSPDDTVKGWEVSKGRYLPVEDAELERFAARQEKTIRILQFVELPRSTPSSSSAPTGSSRRSAPSAPTRC